MLRCYSSEHTSINLLLDWLVHHVDALEAAGEAEAYNSNESQSKTP